MRLKTPFRFTAVLCVAFTMSLPTSRLCASDESTSLQAPAIRALIADLGADHFRARRDAQRRLIEVGAIQVEEVLEQCIQAYAANKDVEVQQRLDEVMFHLVDKFVFDAPKGFIGIRLSKTIAGEGELVVHAIEVNEVIPGSGAEEAGMENGDLIIAVDGVAVPADPSTLTFTSAIQSRRPGTIIKVDYLRNGQRRTTPLKLGSRPQEAQIYFRFQQSVEDFYQNWLASELDRVSNPSPANEAAPDGPPPDTGQP